MFPSARRFRAPIWCPSGDGDTREAESTVAESLVALRWVGTHQVRRAKGKLDRRRVRGVLNPCARESKARTGRFLREKLISDHGLSFLPTRADKEQGAGKVRGPFLGMHRAARRLHQLKASTTMDLGISIFPIYV